METKYKLLQKVWLNYNGLGPHKASVSGIKKEQLWNTDLETYYWIHGEWFLERNIFSLRKDLKKELED